jgi:hypothetical protein
MIGDLGAAAIASALKNNSVLRALNLGNNQIGDAGALALAEGFMVNAQLEELYLDGNSFGQSGALALARMLGTNEGLRVFSYFGLTSSIESRQHALQRDDDSNRESENVPSLRTLEDTQIIPRAPALSMEEISFYSRLYDKYESEKEVSHGSPPPALLRGSGLLSGEEASGYRRRLQSAMDSDSSGSVSVDEFLHFLRLL